MKTQLKDHAPPALTLKKTPTMVAKEGGVSGLLSTLPEEGSKGKPSSKTEGSVSPVPSNVSPTSRAGRRRNSNVGIIPEGLELGMKQNHVSGGTTSWIKQTLGVPGVSPLPPEREVIGKVELAIDEKTGTCVGVVV